mgnify:FL=1
MKNNKGFVFIETIIVTVVLTTTLIFLYSNFSKRVLDERKRLYYDDISYIYKTLYIRDAVIESANTSVFENARNGNNYDGGDALDKDINKNSLKYNFVYLFNTESKFCTKYEKDSDGKLFCSAENYISIFNDNSYINNANKLYKFKMLIYLKTEDISNIKKCVNEDVDGFTDESLKNKCINFKNYTEKYSDSNLREFMLTLNKNDANGNGILIALYYEKKNGDENSGLVKGGYKACIQNKVCEGNLNGCENKLNDYYNQDDISYSMACENAYYLSWVYYD